MSLPITSSTRQILPRALKAFAAVLTVLVIFVFVINFSIFDEKLDPEISANLEPTDMPPSRQNAYVALWGMPAAAGLDIIEVGQGLLTRHDQKAKASLVGHELSDEDFKEFYQQQELDKPWIESFVRCNPRAKPGCLVRMEAAVPELQNNDRVQLIVERYQQLIDLPYYREYPFDSVYDILPNYGILMAASQIHLATLYFEQSPQFLDAIAKDMKFWKQMLDAEGTLVAKMVAVAGVWKNAQFLSEYIGTQTVDEQEASKIKGIIAPLTPSELNIAEVWKLESHFFMSAEVFDDPLYFFIFDDSNYNAFTAWLQQSLQQLNATKNLSYHTFWRPLESVSAMSPNELHDLILRTKLSGDNPLDCCRTDKGKPTSFFPMNFYNLFGKQSINAMDWTPIDYVERVFDLQGILHLVNLQLEIATSESDSIEVLIKNSQYKNPHTLAPMTYDTSSNSLSFQCQDKAGVCEINL